MDENCLVSINRLVSNAQYKISVKFGRKPTVMGKSVGIVRKTIYNNHRTKYRLVRKSGGWRREV